MEGSFRFPEVKSMAFSSINDGRQGDLLVVGCFQTIFDIAVVIGGQGNLFILNDFLFNR
jgi:hypothetical protein